jgi:hypothetical protein
MSVKQCPKCKVRTLDKNYCRDCGKRLTMPMDPKLKTQLLMLLYVIIISICCSLMELV